jgi:hypothetical protein
MGAVLASTVAAALLVVASLSSFYLAAGSDSGVEIRTTPLPAKALALVMATAALIWAAFGKRTQRLPAVVLFALSVAVLGVATHAVVLNYKRGLVQEHWFFRMIDRASFDVADGLSHDWQVRPAIGGVSMHHRRTQDAVFIFTGFGPWTLDVGSLLD